jgi:hypothetical protein
MGRIVTFKGPQWQEEVEAAAPVALVPELRNLLGAFLFRGDDILKPVSVLSGGERSRLQLALLMLSGANLLLLDERLIGTGGFRVDSDEGFASQVSPSWSSSPSSRPSSPAPSASSSSASRRPSGSCLPS